MNGGQLPGGMNMGNIMQNLPQMAMMFGDGDFFDGDFLEDMYGYGMGMMGEQQQQQKQKLQSAPSMRLRKPRFGRRPSRLLRKPHVRHPSASKKQLRKPREFPWYLFN